MESYSMFMSEFSEPTTKEPRVFECPTCNQRFTRLHTLKNHLSVHDNGAVHKCSICDKRFGRLNDKKRHERNQHGQKKFICRGQHQSGGFWGCGKAFARKDALGEHLRSQTGQRCRERVYHAESSTAPSVVTIDLTGDDSDSTIRDSQEPENASNMEFTSVHQAPSKPAGETSQSWPGGMISRHHQIDYIGEDHETSPAPGASSNELVTITRPTYTIFSDFLVENLSTSGASFEHNPLFFCPVCSRAISRLDRFKAHLLEHLQDYTQKRSPYYCLECAQSFAFPRLLTDHQHSGPKCGGSIKPHFREFLRTQVLRSGRLHPLKWEWGCGQKFETHSGFYHHICSTYKCRDSLGQVERWIADYLSAVLSSDCNSVVNSSEARAQAVAQREELTRWLLNISDQQKQAIALKVVAKYDLVKMLLEGTPMGEIKEMIRKDIAREQYELTKRSMDEKRERDVMNALWEAVDGLPSGLI